ncbi:hypothetical protein Forpi1262_v006955 [Fusarium oxysporum f. sp. raphani]|uniref:Uncharacterized protein n=1 Tax=Fusarium oxysporum f. sp. raphani TaxID=96318 RepID=A0A8J5PSG3_FUSOX|nr:hypothetical protein Forpi1262_v006955 [Fusarium oxysporum f. sp. raphani]
MLNKQVGFFKSYNWNNSITNHDYSKQPFSQVFFGNPTSKTKGASGGKITLIYEAGECVKKLNLKATQTGKGYQIQAGFK